MTEKLTDKEVRDIASEIVEILRADGSAFVSHEVCTERTAGLRRAITRVEYLLGALWLTVLGSALTHLLR